MSKELDQDNIISALTGEPIVRTCVTCEHYEVRWFNEAQCSRLLELKYHPVTGKKTWMNDYHDCVDDRCLGSRAHRPEDPCGPAGKHWEQKPHKKFWYKFSPKWTN